MRAVLVILAALLTLAWLRAPAAAELAALTAELSAVAALCTLIRAALQGWPYLTVSPWRVS